METNVPLLIFGGFLATIVVVTLVSAYLYYFRLWLGAFVAGAAVPLPALFAMSFRRVSPQVIVRAYIAAHKNSIELSLDELETHHRDGGHVQDVVEAMIVAKRSTAPVSFVEARALDLQGKNPVEHAKALAGSP